MKYHIIVLSFFMSISIVNAQEINKVDFNEKVQSLDSTIKTLYSIISGSEDKERNWELFKFLFKDDAEITLSINKSTENKTKYYLKVDEFINTYGKWLKENGLYAKETERAISTFRHMNSVSSTYQYNYYSGGSYQDMNRINLLKDNNRWYISNLKWNQKVSDLVAIKEFLPNKQN